MADIPSRRSTIIAERFTVEGNTFKRAVTDNPRDKIEIEIGDSKQPDFKPQAKISRWFNEVNFSLRAQEHPEAIVRTEGKLIKYITPDYEVHQYELDPGEIGEDGGLEFEWVLPTKPASNVLTATIQTKELDFFYQPALTQEEIDEGSERPENVVGSYAVYHKTKGGMNRDGGMEYKTGKAFHIYRPKVTDKDGSETWAELNIDEASGVLSVTVPQEFLDKAAYPVIVDPTMGYTSAGGTTTTGGGNTQYCQVTASEGGTISKFTMYIDWAFSGTGDFNTALYSDSSDNPNSKLDTAATVTKANGAAWSDASISESVTASTKYHFGMHNAGGPTRWYYDTGWSGVSDSDSTTTALPATASPTDTNTGRSYSIYATYTPSISHMYVATGTYTGSGVARSISGAGFQPEAIFIHSTGNRDWVMWTDTMPSGDATRLRNDVAFETNLVTGVNPGGFSLENGGDVNANGETYHWVAIASGGVGQFKTFTYTGNGSDNRSITGIGFQPAYVITKGDHATTGAHRFEDNTSGNSTAFFGSGERGDEIQAFESDGFQLGTSSLVNSNGVVYCGVAFKEVSGQQISFSYTGDGNDDRDITTPGFTPRFVIVDRRDGDDPHVRSDTYATDLSSPVAGTAAANNIQDFTASGFEVGTSGNVNTNAQVYLAFALGEPLDYLTPSISDSATITESVTVSIETLVSDLAISVSDSSTITEAVTVDVSDPQITVSDSATITDSLPAYSQIEQATITESVGLLITTELNVSVSDSATITEAVTTVVSDPQVSATENSTITDSPNVAFQTDDLQINVSDSSTVTDSLPAYSQTEQATITESVSATVVAVSTDITISVSDSTTITESVGVIDSDPQISVAENITISENTAISIPTSTADIQINVSDTITITESVTPTISKPFAVRLSMLTDMHYGQNDMGDYAAMLTQHVTDINTYSPDLVISNGDQFHQENLLIETNADYLPQAVTGWKNRMSNLTAPYLWVWGNHDQVVRADMEAELTTQGITYTEPRKYAQGAYDIILIDGGPGNGSSVGTIDSVDITWLQNNLDANRPSLVFCHYPVNNTSGLFQLTNKAQFLETLQNYGNVLALFTGHDHNNLNQTYEYGINVLALRRSGGSWGTSAGFSIIDLWIEDGVTHGDFFTVYGSTTEANAKSILSDREPVVSDTATITESVSLVVSDPQVVASESATITESVGVTVSTLDVPAPSVSDTATITESVTVDVSDPQIAASESATITESVALGVGDRYRKNDRLNLDIGSGLSMPIGQQRMSTWGSNSRPSNPKTGAMGFNIQTKKLEIYDGESWYTFDGTILS